MRINAKGIFQESFHAVPCGDSLHTCHGIFIKMLKTRMHHENMGSWIDMEGDGIRMQGY